MIPPLMTSRLAAFLVLFLVIPALAQTPGMRFRNVNTEVGLPATGKNVLTKKFLVELFNGGVAIFDCDNDGKLDVAVINSSTVERYKAGGDPVVTLYRQQPNFKFTDATESAGLIARGLGMGLSVADYDNDGMLDLYITRYNGNILLRNTGACKFQDVTAKAGVAGGGLSTGSAWGDYDRDGFVDLFVSRYAHSDITKIKTNYKGMMVEAPWGMEGETDFLFRNRGDGTFEEVAKKAGVQDTDGRLGLGVVWGDYDNDGWLDLYVANDTIPNYLYRNKHDGTFEDAGLMTGAAVSGEGKPLGSMGIDFYDFDNNGWLDIPVGTFAYEPGTLFYNLGEKGFADIAWTAKIGQPTFRLVSWGLGFADFDNSGLALLLVVNGHIYPEIDDVPGEPPYREPIVLFRNKGDKTFEDVAKASGINDEPPQSRRGVAFGDLDNDGDIDVVTFNEDGAPSFILNETKNSNHRVMFKLVGTTSNRAAIGTRVTIQSGDKRQMQEVKAGQSYLSCNDFRRHFGIGAATKLDSVEVRWPNGQTMTLKDLAADRLYTITEGKGITSTTELPLRN